VVTTDTVKSVLAGVLHLQAGAAGVNPAWDAVLPQALSQARSDVTSALAAQGLTRAQMALWEGYDASVTSQALFYCLALGSALLPTPVNSRELEALDQREKIPDMVLTDSAGNVIAASPAARLVGHDNIAGGHADLQSRSRRHPRGAFIGADGRFMRW
jgi:hypothetical protein